MRVSNFARKNEEERRKCGHHVVGCERKLGRKRRAQEKRSLCVWANYFGLSPGSEINKPGAVCATSSTPKPGRRAK